MKYLKNSFRVPKRHHTLMGWTWLCKTSTTALLKDEVMIITISIIFASKNAAPPRQAAPTAQTTRPTPLPIISNQNVCKPKTQKLMITKIQITDPN